MNEQLLSDLQDYLARADHDEAGILLARWLTELLIDIDEEIDISDAITNISDAMLGEAS
jgi:hypothetical protein